MDFVVPLVFCFALGVALIYGLTASMAPAERDALRRLLVLALVARLAMATMFALVPETRIFHEDADGYELTGRRIAAGWAGHAPPFHSPEGVPNRGFFYIAAAIYYVMFEIPSSVSYVNAIIGALSVLYVYRLSRRFFHPLVARMAALLTAFIPSMVLWSSIALKDPLMTLLVLMSLDACVALRRRFSIGAVLGVVLPLVAMLPIRFYMIYFLAFAIAGSLLFERGTRLATGVPKQLLVAVGVGALLVLVGLTGAAQQSTEFLDLSRVSSFRHGMAVSANSGYDADVDVSTPGRALAFLPFGLATLLLSPFPWQFTSLRASFALPEMLVWWALFPATIGGVLFAIKKRLRQLAPLVIFTVTLTAAYSLVHGNIGSGFRQRAQIFVVLFIFTALGWYRRKLRRRGLDENLLFVDS